MILNAMAVLFACLPITYVLCDLMKVFSVSRHWREELWEIRVHNIVLGFSPEGMWDPEWVHTIKQMEDVFLSWQLFGWFWYITKANYSDE